MASPPRFEGANGTECQQNDNENLAYDTVSTNNRPETPLSDATTLVPPNDVTFTLPDDPDNSPSESDSSSSDSTEPLEVPNTTGLHRVAATTNLTGLAQTQLTNHDNGTTPPATVTWREETWTFANLQVQQEPDTTTNLPDSPIVGGVGDQGARTRESSPDTWSFALLQIQQEPHTTVTQADGPAIDEGAQTRDSPPSTWSFANLRTQEPSTSVPPNSPEAGNFAETTLSPTAVRPRTPYINNVTLPGSPRTLSVDSTQTITTENSDSDSDDDEAAPSTDVEEEDAVLARDSPINIGNTFFRNLSLNSTALRQRLPRTTSSLGLSPSIGVSGVTIHHQEHTSSSSPLSPASRLLSYSNNDETPSPALSASPHLTSNSRVPTLHLNGNIIPDILQDESVTTTGQPDIALSSENAVAVAGTEQSETNTSSDNVVTPTGQSDSTTDFEDTVTTTEQIQTNTSSDNVVTPTGQPDIALSSENAVAVAGTEQIQTSISSDNVATPTGQSDSNTDLEDTVTTTEQIQTNISSDDVVTAAGQSDSNTDLEDTVATTEQIQTNISSDDVVTAAGQPEPTGINTSSDIVAATPSETTASFSESTEHPQRPRVITLQDLFASHQGTEVVSTFTSPYQSEIPIQTELPDFTSTSPPRQNNPIFPRDEVQQPVMTRRLRRVPRSGSLGRIASSPEPFLPTPPSSPTSQAEGKEEGEEAEIEVAAANKAEEEDDEDVAAAEADLLSNEGEEEEEEEKDEEEEDEALFSLNQMDQADPAVALLQAGFGHLEAARLEIDALDVDLPAPFFGRGDPAAVRARADLVHANGEILGAVGSLWRALLQGREAYEVARDGLHFYRGEARRLAVLVTESQLGEVVARDRALQNAAALEEARLEIAFLRARLAGQGQED